MYSGAVSIWDMEDPSVEIVPETQKAALDYAAAISVAGLCGVAFGQLLVGCGRYLSLHSSKPAASPSWPFNLVLVVSLVLILALFKFVSLFELLNIEILKIREKEDLYPSEISYNIRGMMQWSCLAYVLFIGYCGFDIIRVVVVNLFSVRVKVVEE